MIAGFQDHPQQRRDGALISRRRKGLARIFAYAINARAPKLGEKIQKRAQESGTVLLDSSEILARESDVIIATVTANAAAAVFSAARRVIFFGIERLLAGNSGETPTVREDVAVRNRLSR